MRRFLFSLLLAAFIAPLAAQPDETYNFNPGRPGFAYGSTPLLRHTISAEAFVRTDGFAYMPLTEAGHVLNRYTVRYSPLDRLELALGVGLEHIPSNPAGQRTMLSPLSLMARINILKKKGNLPGLAFIGELSLPVGAGSSEAVSPGVNPTGVIAIDHNYKRFSFIYNVGAEWLLDDHGVDLFYAFMVCYGVDTKGRWNIYGEFVGHHAWAWDFEDGNDEWKFKGILYDLKFRFGADFFITKNLKLDFSFALNPFYVELQGEIGLSYGIPLKKLQR